MKLSILEPSPRESGAILICDEGHNDIAEFYHNEHATVEQSYETALMLAQALVSASAVGAVKPLDQAWEAINTLGGSGSTPEELAYVYGIECALDEIEALGGMDPKQRKTA